MELMVQINPRLGDLVLGVIEGSGPLRLDSGRDRRPYGAVIHAAVGEVLCRRREQIVEPGVDLVRNARTVVVEQVLGVFPLLLHPLSRSPV